MPRVELEVARDQSVIDIDRQAEIVGLFPENDQTLFKAFPRRVERVSKVIVVKRSFIGSFFIRDVKTLKAHMNFSQCERALENPG